MLYKHFPRPGTKYIKNDARFPGPFFLPKASPPSAGSFGDAFSLAFHRHQEEQRAKNTPKHPDSAPQGGTRSKQGRLVLFQLHHGTGSITPALHLPRGIASSL